MSEVLHTITKVNKESELIDIHIFSTSAVVCPAWCHQVGSGRTGRTNTVPTPSSPHSIQDSLDMMLPRSYKIRKHKEFTNLGNYVYMFGTIIGRNTWDELGSFDIFLCFAVWLIACYCCSAKYSRHLSSFRLGVHCRPQDHYLRTLP